MRKIVFETIGLFLGFCIMVFLIGSLVGCTGYDNYIQAKTKSGTPLGHERFQIIEGEYRNEAILVDTETGVEYLWMNPEDYFAGGLTVLLDHNGNPLVAEGYRDH